MDEGLWRLEARPEPTRRKKMDLNALWGAGSLMNKACALCQGLSLQTVYYLQGTKDLDQVIKINIW